MVPKTLTVDHGGNASLSFEAIAIQDGSNDPIIVADSGNSIADLFATIIVTALGAILNTVKANVGLAYAAGF